MLSGNLRCLNVCLFSDVRGNIGLANDTQNTYSHFDQVHISEDRECSKD